MNILRVEPVNNSCKGRVYRAKRSSFVNDRGDCTEKVTMVLQKRLSCPGCEHCCSLPELLNEQVSENGIILSRVTHDDYYALIVLADGYDEFGHADSWEIDFTRYKIK